MITALVITSDVAPSADRLAALSAPPDGAGTVVEEVLRTLLQSEIDGVTVVTGRQGRVIERLLQRRPCRLVHDWDWPLGDSAAAIALGMQRLPGEAEAVLVCAGDDLSLTPARVSALIAGWRQGQTEDLSAQSGAAGAAFPAFIRRPGA